MARLILPTPDLAQLLEKRRMRGADRFDEIWDGTYVMAPPPDIEHAVLATHLAAALITALEEARTLVVQNLAVADRTENWQKNFRVPDVAVVRAESSAQNRGTHFVGGPDLVIEIVSPGDRTRKKLGFYARVGVRELLLVDRNPWKLELYRLDNGALNLAGISEPGASESLPSLTTGLDLRLLPAEPRPRIELRRPSDGATWLA